MPKAKDVGHPWGWRPYAYGQGELNFTCVYLNSTRHSHSGQKRSRPGYRTAYSLRLYNVVSEAGPFGNHGTPFVTMYEQRFPLVDYVARCMFWSVPVVELAKAVLSGKSTPQEEHRLHEILASIPEPPAIRHRLPSATGEAPRDPQP